ncbi:MAG: helix-turn-helix transcriptional regulator [Clostridia bacterium]
MKALLSRYMPAKLVFIPEGTTRAAKTEGMECMAFNFFSNLILDEVLPTVSTFRDCAAVDYWLREYNRAWLTSKGSLKGKAAFLMLFWELFQRNAKEAVNPHVEKMKQCIADHLTEPFSLDRIAQCVHLHPVYCESLFREYEHCTPAQYQTQLRDGAGDGAPCPRGFFHFPYCGAAGL